jgi:putative oxidoreductase
MMNFKTFMKCPTHPACVSTGLLILRIVAGTAFAFHGWGKIQNPMSWMGPDAPVPGFLQFLAALSEFGGGIAWVLGLFTPIASLGIICTMLVATGMHLFVMKDPFVASGPGQSSYELAAVYLAVAIAFFVTGPGKFSGDAKVFGQK